MKFTIETECNCGGRYVFSAYGDAEFGPTTCTNCEKSAYLTDPLTVSVTAERLLLRSKRELESGDYSLSILVAVMAVESYLTRLFLKLKGIDSYIATFKLPTPAQEGRAGERVSEKRRLLRPNRFCVSKGGGDRF